MYDAEHTIIDKDTRGIRFPFAIVDPICRLLA